jgi:hypothetical protein
MRCKAMPQGVRGDHSVCCVMSATGESRLNIRSRALVNRRDVVYPHIRLAQPGAQVQFGVAKTRSAKVDNQKITISENFQKSRSPKIQIVARNLEPIAPQQGAVFLVTIGDKAARLVLHLSPLPDAQPPRCTAAKRSTPLTVPLMKRRHPSG